MLKLAIDFGTSMTKIYEIGSGIVLAEATCVNVQKDTGEIRAFGNEAKKLLGKTAESTTVNFPVFEGDIVNERQAGALLEYFLRKVTKRSSIEAIFCVPCGINTASREKYYRVAKTAGISRIGFVETPYLAALGEDVPLSESNPVFAIDFGAGKTSMAAFSLDGIIAGLSMNVGGNNMDIHVIDHIAETFNLKIGSLTSEKLKNTVGSLIAGDSQSMIINGRDIVSGKPRSVSVSSEDISFPVRIYVDKIIEYAGLLLQKLPAEVSAAMCKNGVYLSGGVCMLAGFEEYIAEKLQMETHLPENPQMAVILGGGRAVGNSAILRRIQMI
ncbi:MAG: rod shape-determining protein [Clostridia bacterium]|nr:rod shape-determining protein [Clostridia bacterium]MDE6676299.1 rod shape-determining protein [Clostridia bacterium]